MRLIFIITTLAGALLYAQQPSQPPQPQPSRIVRALPISPEAISELSDAELDIALKERKERKERELGVTLGRWQNEAMKIDWQNGRVVRNTEGYFSSSNTYVVTVFFNPK